MRDAYNAILLGFAAGAVWDVQHKLALVRFQAVPAAFIGRNARRKVRRMTCDLA